jgi:hypothetical protein
MSGQQYRVDFPSSKTSSSSSRRYDFSGEQEIRKRQDAISEMTNQKLKALYEGDIMAAMAASKRIRALRDSISGIEPVKVEAESSHQVADFDGPTLHASKPAQAKPEPKEEAQVTDVSMNAPRRAPGDDPKKKPGTVTV